MNQSYKKQRLRVTDVARSAAVIGLTVWLTLGANPGITASKGAVSSVVEARADGRVQQPPQQKPDARNPQEKRATWRVRVATNANPVKLQIRADDVPLAKIAASIARQMRVPVMVSPALEQHRVTLKADDMLLETALRSLAPRAYVDYIISGESAGSPPSRYKAIYLHALDEPAPDMEAGFTSSIGLTLIEGNTDDMLDGDVNNAAAQPSGEAPEPPILVSYADNKLSVRARRQSLTMVMFEIANATEIPLDLQLESGQLVDVDFKGYELEQAVRALPSKAQLHLRTDLQTMTTTPLRLVLAAK